MKNKVMLMFASAMFCACFFISSKECTAQSKPSIEEIKGTVVDYLKKPPMPLIFKNCKGSMSLNNFNILKIGDYECQDKDPKLHGWPVYVQFEATCSNGGTYSSDGKTSSVMVRKVESGYEAFSPIPEEEQADLEKKLEEMGKKMESDWEKFEKKAEKQETKK
jgi:hypothetical protein